MPASPLLTCVLLAAAICLGVVATGGEAGKRKEAAPAAGELAARRLLKRARDLLLADEAERAVKMLETIVEQHPKSDVRFEAYLTLGKHYLDAGDPARGVNVLRHLGALQREDAELAGRARELYVEGLYLTGVAQYQMRQYGAAFPILRKITNRFPNTVWANQSYYYIGMCHFMQGNWSKAIQALSLVGTFVDPTSPTVQYAEAGRRFYVKIEDADLPVLMRLGKQVHVAVGTKHGDKETLPCIPLAGEQGIFIASIATAIGPATPGDDTLQVVGGDEITTTYLDDNTKKGEKDVARVKKVQVVSTAVLRFTLGTFDAKASAAFLGQPLFVLLHDVDQDAGPERDTVVVKIRSRYKEPEAEAATAEGLAGAIEYRDEEERRKVRDEVTLKLAELAPPAKGQRPPAQACHVGRFGGSVQVAAVREEQVVDRNDQVLSCALDDEIVAVYIDELHLGGRAPRQVTAQIRVVGEIDGRPRATQNVVPDDVLRSKRDLVEATAFLELARIFKSMGLRKGAKEKADEGLERVDAIIRLQTPIPSSLRERAFELKWELYMAQDDFRNAIATCRLFNKLFPDSPFADQALMGIGKSHLENHDYAEGIGVLREVTRLPTSQTKPEAQYLIATAVEAQVAARAAKAGAPPKPEAVEAAMQQYKLCADRYPESEFAGKALAKLINYHVTTRDFARAEDLLEQVFQDYPDGDFLDSMLLKWVVVAYRKGDFKTAHSKCSQLLFEYPASAHAATAKQILPKIEKRLGRDAESETPGKEREELP